MKLRLSFLLLVACFPAVTAAPSGASACPGGQPAVGGPHLREGAVNGTLADGGVSLTIGDTVMTPDETFEASLMEAFSLAVTASQAPMRGILVRLECQTDLTGALTSSSELLQDAAVCAQDDNFVVGMTHNSNVDKASADMEIVLDTFTTVSVDVTIVMANNGDEGSIYYYDRFYFSAKHPECNICGDLGEVQNPTGTVPIPPEFGLEGMESITCGDAAELGKAGQIAPEICALTPTLAAGICQCGDGSGGGTETPGGTSVPETETGTPTAAPSMEPTSGGAMLSRFLSSLVVVSLIVAMM